MINEHTINRNEVRIEQKNATAVTEAVVRDA
jgi:hypothetical protein